MQQALVVAWRELPQFRDPDRALVGDRMFVFSLDGRTKILEAFLTTVHLPGG